MPSYYVWRPVLAARPNAIEGLDPILRILRKHPRRVKEWDACKEDCIIFTCCGGMQSPNMTYNGLMALEPRPRNSAYLIWNLPHALPKPQRDRLFARVDVMFAWYDVRDRAAYVLPPWPGINAFSSGGPITDVPYTQRCDLK